MQVNKILVIRMDRLGDFLLSLPAVGALKARFPEVRVAAYVRSYVAPAARLAEDIDEVLVADSSVGRARWRGLSREAERIRGLGCDCSVSFWQDPFTAAAVWRSGVRERYSNLRHWQDLLFCNHRIRQERRLCAMSEWEYNVELMRIACGGELGAPRVRLGVPPDETIPRHLREIVEKGDFMVIHPGMGGSALNWPAERYAQLACRMAEEREIRVLITGGPGEEELSAAVAEEAQHKNIRSVTGLSLEDFVWLLSHARLFFGPSTGPLHLAASLHRPVVGLYSPVKAQSPKRWRPFESEEGLLFKALVPAGRDLKEIPSSAAVMEEINLETAAKAIQDLLSASSVPS